MGVQPMEYQWPSVSCTSSEDGLRVSMTRSDLLFQTRHFDAAPQMPNGPADIDGAKFQQPFRGAIEAPHPQILIHHNDRERDRAQAGSSSRCWWHPIPDSGSAVPR